MKLLDLDKKWLKIEKMRKNVVRVRRKGGSIYIKLCFNIKMVAGDNIKY